MREQEGMAGWTLDADLLVHRLGPAIAQAEDGTLLLGTTADVTRAALPAAESEARVPVPTEGALSFLVSRQAWGGAVSLLPLTLPGLDTLMKVEQATGNLVLSDEPRLSVALEPRPGTEAGALARDVESLLGGLRVLALVVPGDLGGAKHALGKATVRAEAGAVRVEAPWPYEALDEAVRRLAELARTGQRAPQAERPAWLPF
ncbi:MAG: hypothetical protein HY744_18290 [Deltaproteobacteria bacterium]|nr:hypothetical protein [Deltaproteobacteria bacterium]